jgi:hypothetical protein
MIGTDAAENPAQKGRMADPNPNWIPLMDYAMKTGTSLSTLRRHIKSQKIPYRIENGRYLVPLEPSAHLDERPSWPAQVAAPAVSTSKDLPKDPPKEANIIQLQARIRQMSLELQKAREEIVELKTLIAFYEENGK